LHHTSCLDVHAGLRRALFDENENRVSDVRNDAVQCKFASRRVGQADEAVVDEALGVVFTYSEKGGHDLLHFIEILITAAWS
jgi:hypothetical protein